MLTEFAREILLRPRRVLAGVLALPLGPGARWQAFAAVVLVSTLVSWLFLMAVDRDGSLAMMMPSPVTLAIANAVLLLGITLAVHLLGRGLGGRGAFGDSLLAMTLLQAVMLVVQAVQMVVLLLSGLLAEILGLASILLLIWLLANFVMEVHGFRSLARVALGIIGAIVGLSMILSFLLVLAGISGQGV